MDQKLKKNMRIISQRTHLYSGNTFFNLQGLHRIDRIKLSIFKSVDNTGLRKRQIY